jgi:hypothetical protein
VKELDIEKRKDFGPVYSKSLYRLQQLVKSHLPVVNLIEKLSSLAKKENGEEML